MAKHMNENDRKRIEFLLSLNWSASEIARDRGRPESTILREIHGRRIRSDSNYGCSNRICAHYDFVELHGEAGMTFLEKLGITRVPANQVTLDPMLLGAKFKRHADKTTMEKYDVRKSDPAMTQK